MANNFGILRQAAMAHFRRTRRRNFFQAAMVCIDADRKGVAWGLLPRRVRRQLARHLHQTRELTTSWPDQWQVTREAGRASIPA